MYKNKTIFLVFLGLTFSPLLVSAQGLRDALLDATDIADLLVLLAISAALLAFLWGLAKFIAKSGNAESASEGKRVMIYGILALFVIASIWGIISLVQDEFNLSPTNVGGLPPLQDVAE